MKYRLGFYLTIISGVAMAQQPSLIDDNASKKTRNLYSFLHQSSKHGMLFGHQDDLAYGVGWWNVGGESDVKKVTGKYPAVFGWDFGHLGQKRNIDSVRFEEIRKGIKRVYKMRGINTISWHMMNPFTGEDSWSQTSTLKELLPGGRSHEKYLKQLDLFASTIKSYRTGLFSKIPIIFRPFHEHNGEWFWWGLPNNSEADYISLWRFTVDYLKDQKKIHNLIYAYSPDKSRFDQVDFRDSYLYGYPGDEYVDILGLDNYWDAGDIRNIKTGEEQEEEMALSLSALVSLAREKGKVAALTETGNDMLTISNWYTNRLLKPYQDGVAGGIAYALVWRNNSKDHHYVPYPEHDSVEDFILFEQSDLTLFLSDIPNPYNME